MEAEGKTELKLGEGEWRVEKGDLAEWGCFVLDKPTKISGQGRGNTTLVEFGLKTKGNKSDGIVEIENLKIKGAVGFGLYAYHGMKVIMRGCSVEDCQQNGVIANFADISCDDLQVIGCGLSGVFAGTNATITLSGQGTTIQGNVTKGNSGYNRLTAFSSSSTLQSSSPSFQPPPPPPLPPPRPSSHPQYSSASSPCTNDDVPSDGSSSVIFGIWRCSTGHPCTCNFLICGWMFWVCRRWSIVWVV